MLMITEWLQWYEPSHVDVVRLQKKCGEHAFCARKIIFLSGSSIVGRLQRMHTSTEIRFICFAHCAYYMSRNKVENA